MALPLSESEVRFEGKTALSLRYQAEPGRDKLRKQMDCARKDLSLLESDMPYAVYRKSLGRRVQYIES